MDNSGRRLFVSDSSNNRIVVTTLEGQFIEDIGSGGAGLKDGAPSEAAFRNPQVGGQQR